MKKVLATTNNDNSEPYFAGWEIFKYSDEITPIECDLVYFRDPFNDPNYVANPDEINAKIGQISAQTSVDGVTSFSDMQKVEDKWLQYQDYADFMPQTWLPSTHEFRPGLDMAKPRISQRAKDILFELGDRQIDDSWIIQEKMDIQEELRIYVVRGQILKTASIKSSKSSGKVKVLGTRELSSEEYNFVNELAKYCPLDFYGLDLAILAD